jgi:hypothetical protein
MYRVIVANNFHYMDEEERTTHGEFETLDAAIVVGPEVRPWRKCDL